MLTDTKSGGNFCYPVAMVSYLFFSFNLEFFGEFCLLIHVNLLYLLKLRSSGFYKIPGD